MWLEALITREDFAKVLSEFLPVQISLHPDAQVEDTKQYLKLGQATNVELVPQQGVRITCPAAISLHMLPTFELNELKVLMKPVITERPTGSVMEFHLVIEEADFHLVPDFVDNKIVEKANEALVHRKVSWDFTRTLTHSIEMPKWIDPIDRLQIAPHWGKVRVGRRALSVVISFKLDFARKD